MDLAVAAEVGGGDGARPQPEGPPEILLPPGIEPQAALGRPGRPLDRRTPFYIGLTGALGVAVAYLLVRALADVADVLLLVGLAMFIAVGLDPVVAALTRRGLPRGGAVGLIVLGFVLVVGGFLAAAVPPVAHEVSTLVDNLPRYRSEIEQGKGWLGHLAVRLHLTSYVRRSSSIHLSSLAGGYLGAGKLVLSGAVATVTVVVLTIYFLVALPAVRRFWVSLVPASRRPRVEVLTDEAFGRIGGFVLGNLVTSLVTGVGTTVWLLAFGVPYAVLIGLFVAVADLVPVIGSTVGGAVASVVALVKGFPVAIATAGFYIAYRFFEDYLLTPRVMRHTVRISPGLTIIATLIGGTLLGLIGALIAIPCAATIYLLLEEIVFPRMDQA